MHQREQRAELREPLARDLRQAAAARVFAVGGGAPPGAPAPAVCASGWVTV